MIAQQDPSTVPTLSVVVPAYNEEEVIEAFHARLTAVLATLKLRYEIIYVNDGSTDGTARAIELICGQQKGTALVELSRNFGKEIALTAGLDHASGEYVVCIDADLQDPPELIPDLIERCREGFDVVYATRAQRLGESWLKRQTATAFYRIMERVGSVRIPRDTGDFRLMNRRAVAAVCSLREHHRFMKGLFAWVGFRQTAISYQRDPRFAGETKWNYWRLWNLAIEGITSFTVAPLKVSTYLGMATAGFAFCYGTYIVLKTLAFGRDLPGYPSLMVVVLFLGGIQLIVLGLIGEYLGRVFNETKQRPLYYVSRTVGTNAVTEAPAIDDVTERRG
jgi:glycosyltransferase involved in cell wall biosynthesis